MLTAAEQTYRDTSRALVEITQQRDAALALARQTVERDFRDRRDAAGRARNEAKRVLDAELIAAAETNPLIGCKVMKPARPGSYSYSGSPERHGIVEIWVNGAPSRKTYNPDPGDLVVRLLKKDGKPAADYERFCRDELPHGWKLEEAR